MEVVCFCQPVALVWAMFCTGRQKQEKRNLCMKQALLFCHDSTIVSSFSTVHTARETKVLFMLLAAMFLFYTGMQHLVREASQSAHSHWLMQFSAKYSINVSFTLQDVINKTLKNSIYDWIWNWRDFNPVGNITITSINPAHYRMIWADNLFRPVGWTGKLDPKSAQLSPNVGPTQWYIWKEQFDVF